MSSPKENHGHEEEEPTMAPTTASNWAIDQDAFVNVWKCLAVCRVFVMLFITYTGGWLLGSLEGATSYKLVQSSSVACHAIFYKYDQLGSKVDLNVGEHFGWGHRPNISEIEELQMGYQVSRYFGGEAEFDQATDVSMAYDLGDKCQIDLLSRGDPDQWLMLERQHGTEVPMSAHCGGDNPGLWHVDAMDFYVLKVGLIVWFLLKLQGMYIDWIITCGLAKRDQSIWFWIKLTQVLWKDLKDSLTTVISSGTEGLGLNHTRQFRQENSHANSFRRATWLVFTVIPNIIILPITTFQVNEVCAQIVTTAFSERVHFLMNRAVMLTLVDLLVVAWVFHSILGLRSRTPVSEEEIAANRFRTHHGEEEHEDEERRWDERCARRCLGRRTGEKLIWLEGSGGQGVKCQNFSADMMKVVVFNGHPVKDAHGSYAVQGDESGTGFKAQGRPNEVQGGESGTGFKAQARPDDLYKAFTYKSLDPMNMLKEVTIWCWWYAEQIPIAYLWPLARYVIPAKLSQCKTYLAEHLIPSGSDSSDSEGCPCPQTWQCLASCLVPCLVLLLGVLLYSLFVFFIVLGVLLMIFWIQAPVMPLLTSLSMGGYWVWLFCHSVEIPFIFLNMSWLLYFRYPQFDLSFQVSMFYVLTAMLGCVEVLSLFSETLTKKLKNGNKHRKTASKFIAGKLNTYREKFESMRDEAQRELSMRDESQRVQMNMNL